MTHARTYRQGQRLQNAGCCILQSEPWHCQAAHLPMLVSAQDKVFVPGVELQAGAASRVQLEHRSIDLPARQRQPHLSPPATAKQHQTSSVSELLRDIIDEELTLRLTCCRATFARHLQECHSHSQMQPGCSHGLALFCRHNSLTPSDAAYFPCAHCERMWCSRHPSDRLVSCPRLPHR